MCSRTSLSVLLLLLSAARGQGEGQCTRRPLPKDSEYEMCRSCQKLQPGGAESAAMDLDLKITGPRLDAASLAPARRVCKIWADEEGIAKIETDAFASVKCLRHLFLRRNALTSLYPAAFRRNEELETLDLQGNPLVLPSNQPFLYSSSLRKLNLSSCNLTVIYNNTFNEMRNLKILYLNYNRIQRLHIAAFQFLPRLKMLEISENKLISIDFLSDLEINCFAASENPIKNVASMLGDLPRDMELALSRKLCCCAGNESCEGWAWGTADNWNAECSKCFANTVTSTTTDVPRTSKTTLTIRTTNTSLTTQTTHFEEASQTPLQTETLKSILNISTSTTKPTIHEAMPSGTVQSANSVLIMLSVIFTFFLLLQFVFIIILLLRAKRKNHQNTNSLLAVINSEISVPRHVIYGAHEQVTDLDEESCTSLNPVYETIRE